MKKLIITAAFVVAIIAAVNTLRKQPPAAGSLTPASQAELNKRMAQRDKAEERGRAFGGKLAKEEIGNSGSRSIGPVYEQRLEAGLTTQSAADRYPFKDGFRDGYDETWKAERAARLSKRDSAEWKEAYDRGFEFAREIAQISKRKGGGLPTRPNLVKMAHNFMHDHPEEERPPILEGYIAGYTGVMRAN